MQYMKGINLGGWLVLERWIMPTVFEGIDGSDEFSLCEELKDNKDERLEAHRKTFITYNDFQWIREHGFNTIRLPVPHWAFGGFDPYVSCIEYVDFAVSAALEHDLGIILDLHTAPGSQNGEDHSGEKGDVGWHTNPKNIEQTLEVIEKLCQRYDHSPAIVGIELLNEPSSKIPHEVLLDFYKQGYEIVRKYFSDSVSVIVSDAYRPMDWTDAFDNSFKNLILDIHLYQAFSTTDKKLDMHKHIKKAMLEWRELLDKVQKDLPVIVGEWSLGLDKRAFRGHDALERDLALKAYAAAQLETFKATLGWCFWTYKTEGMDGWSAVDAIKRGWLHLNT